MVDLNLSTARIMTDTCVTRPRWVIWWSLGDLEVILNTFYGLRSRALPVNLPSCECDRTHWVTH